MLPLDSASADPFMSPGIQPADILHLHSYFCNSHPARYLFPIAFADRLFRSQWTALELSDYSFTTRPVTSLAKQCMERRHANSSFLEISSAWNAVSCGYENRKYWFPQHPPTPHSVDASTKMSSGHLGRFPRMKSNVTPLLAIRMFSHIRRADFITSGIVPTSCLVRPRIAMVSAERNGLPKGETCAA